MQKLVIIGLFCLLTGCKQTAKKTETPSDEVQSEAPQVSGILDTWVAKRVAKAEVKLKASAAGEIVWNAMQAHGGLQKWYGNGALSFRFNYRPIDGTTPRDSYQTIDTWSNKARHTSAADSTAHFGFTGDSHWIKAADSTAFAYDTKFWALTPIYFLAQPFILDGQGVNLDLLPSTVYKAMEQDVVKVTFDAGTGDAPDDYYVLYFDRKTHYLSAIRYIVSYPAYFKDGGHLPEKFMEVLSLEETDGILLPSGYKTHWLTKDNTPGEYITKIEVSDVYFNNKLPSNYFQMPAGAKVLE